jgi:IMP dehydrogenase
LVLRLKVIGVDIDARKLEWARGLGATHVVDATQTDVVEAVRELTDGNGADVVVEAVGRPETFEQAFYARDLAGTVVLVGVGPGNACTSRGVLGIGVPQATAIADAAGARSRHLEETGRYVHIIADGGMRTGGDIAKAIACGADAVMLGSPLARASEAPGRGFHWGMATFHADLPRGARVEVGDIGSLREILLGPAQENDGTLNLFGALRTSMATTGYANIKEFQKAEVMVAPALQTEGKYYQRAQGIGMGRR